MSLIDIQRPLLTIDEVAERFGQNRRMVERKIKRGELPALQLGGTRPAIPNRRARGESFRSGGADPAAVSISLPEAGRDVAS
jgi:excisionase family DNA binding protein